MPGHWEEDLIQGKKNASAVGTLLDPTTGYLMLVKMNDATATSAVEGFSAKLNGMPLKVCNDPLFFAHLTPLMRGEHWEPHTPMTDVAALHCSNISIDQSLIMARLARLSLPHHT